MRGLSFLLSVTLASSSLAAQTDSPIGTWQGTSICVKAEWNARCNDERVIYELRGTPTSPDSVTLDARKIEGDSVVPMGVFELHFVPAHATWEGEWSNSRVHILWSFAVRGEEMTGTLFVLPSGRVARHVAVRRTAAEP